jgi:hypothetical protein
MPQVHSMSFVDWLSASDSDSHYPCANYGCTPVHAQIFPPVILLVAISDCLEPRQVLPTIEKLVAQDKM